MRFDDASRRESTFYASPALRECNATGCTYPAACTINRRASTVYRLIKTSVRKTQNNKGDMKKPDPEVYILIDHHRVIASLYDIQLDLRDPKPVDALIPLMDRYEVISTPQELYDKHLIRNPISASKALDLSLHKRLNDYVDFPILPFYNTTFEDPKEFYYYPDINMIISPKPVKTFQVCTKDLDQPRAWNRGLKWAVFSGTTYHFQIKSLRIERRFY